MNIIKNILDFLNKKRNRNKENGTEGFCPNCWGRQEYGGNFYKALKSNNINGLSYKKGWVMAYVENNIKGIYFRPKIANLVCKVCYENCKN